MIPTTYGCNKPKHFIEFYIKELKTPKRMLEIGVQTGRSLRMWANAFPEAQVVGIDIDRPTEDWPEKNIIFKQGDQTEVKFIDNLGEFDLIIDDGSHKLADQAITFNVLFHKLTKGGQYVIEDTETWYNNAYSEGYHSTDVFVKTWLDNLHEQYLMAKIVFIKDLVLIEKL